jgi:hypothetical protein
MAILNASEYRVVFPTATAPPRRQIAFLVDESVIAGPSGGVLLLCLAAVEDGALVRRALTDFLSDRIADPFGGTSQADLGREGVHWNALTQDDRTRVTECIRALPFRAFVALGLLRDGSHAAYEGLYGKLFARLLTDRFVRYDGCLVEILVEENSKVGKSALGSLITSAYEELVAHDSRRPEKPPSYRMVAKKEDGALPLPDIVLGILADYLRIELNVQLDDYRKRRMPGEQATKRYQQIRDKVRAVYDWDSGQVFSRRHPLSPWARSR